MKESTVAAITAAFVVYRESLADDLGKQSVKMFISGDLAAQALTGVKVADSLVQAEALQYAKEYGDLLRKEGASIINGKKIYWLKDSTDKMRVDTLNTITKGIEEGKSMPEVTRDLRKTFVREHDYQLRRIARTETARIQNHGATNRYDKLKITHVLVHDNEGPNSCESCAIANGQTWTVEYASSHELEHPNCLTKDTKVMGEFYGIMRSYYSGPVLDIITELGRRLSVTPNHPILTNEGFMPAKSIQKGSELVCYTPFVKDSPIYPDDKHEPVVIEEIFNMLSLLCVVERVPVTSEDLHGDALCGDGYVDIIDMNRFLPYNFKPHILEHLSDIFLTSSTPDEFLLSGVCSHDFSVDTLHPPTASVPSAREHLFFFTGSVPPSFPNHLNCLRAGSNVNSVVYESFFNDGFSTMEFVSKLSESNAGLIEFDHVVDINVREYDDHVYDLLTNTQYYNASGVYIHNCVRSFSPIIPDDWELPE